jgi:hypothetical protein
MNEFEWRRQMRDLNRPVAPRSDLWARIDAVLDDAASSNIAVAAPAAPARHRRSWALAASIAAVVVLAGGLVWRMQVMHGAASIASDHPSLESAPWKPSDPRLAGAALELDAARMELQQAMQQAPDSPALQRLLQRTHAQQNQLRDLEKQAG